MSLGARAFAPSPTTDCPGFDAVASHEGGVTEES